MALLRLPKIVNKMPNAVISKYEAQYGIPATVFSATHGVYIVMPMIKTFRAIKVADARRRTNLLLNLQCVNFNNKKKIDVKTEIQTLFVLNTIIYFMVFFPYCYQ